MYIITFLCDTGVLILGDGGQETQIECVYKIGQINITMTFLYLCLMGCCHANGTGTECYNS